MPTASSAQMRKNVIRRTAHRAIRCSVFLTFLNIRSAVRPVPNKRKPITRKSAGDQLTSAVNCIAIKGISKISPAASKMMARRLVYVIISIIIGS